MIKKFFIGFALMVAMIDLHAQDSLRSHVNMLMERLDLVKQQRNSFYVSPSLRYYQYTFSATPVEISYADEHKEVYNLQEGSGEQGFRFSTESYLKEPFPNMTIWGNASYDHYKRREVQYNETSDLDLLFPYLTADSVGGDINLEDYAFSGGLAKRYARWNLGGELSYRASQSYRTRDPRQKNVSSDLQLTGSVSYNLFAGYFLAATGGLRYYKQENDLSFNRELGMPAVYYLNGLGAYNDLMAGVPSTHATSYFEVLGFQGQLAFVPKTEHGIFMEIGAKQYLGNRTLPRSMVAANDWKDLYYYGKVGYHTTFDRYRIGALAQVDLQTKKGKEGLFHNDGTSSGYIKISERSSYRYYDFNYRLEVFVGQEDWTLKPFVAYQQFKEQYAQPFREQLVDKLNYGVNTQYLMKFDRGLFGISLNLQKYQLLQGKQNFNAVRPGSGIEDLLQTNYRYLVAEPLQISGSIRYDYFISPSVKPFIKVDAGGASIIKQQFYRLSLGMVF